MRILGRIFSARRYLTMIRYCLGRATIGVSQRLSLMIVVGLTAAMPMRANAQSTCNGVTQVGYVNVPSVDTQGSVDRVAIQIGALSIQGGTKMTLSKIFFDLACRHKGCSGNVNHNCTANSDCTGFGGTCLTLLSGTCAPDGTTPGVESVVGYVGNISTTCTTGPPSNAAVTFTATNTGGMPGNPSPSEVVFTSSAAMNIPANTSNFCSVEFDIQKLTSQSFDDTPLTIEQRAGFTDAQCDNGLGAQGINTGSVDFNPTPTATVTNTSTPTATATPTPTETPTSTPPPTGTATGTATQTPTFTQTPTKTPGQNDCCACPDEPDLCSQPTGGQCNLVCPSGTPPAIFPNSSCVGPPPTTTGTPGTPGTPPSGGGCATFTPTPTPTATATPQCLDNGPGGLPDLIPGYCGPLNNDCLSEICVSPPGPHRPNGLPDNHFACKRDDPTCDAVLGDDACTFVYRICFNLKTVEDRFVCSATGPVTNVFLHVPLEYRPGSSVNTENRDAWEAALLKLPGASVGAFKKRSITFNPPLADTICTDSIPYKIPLTQNPRTLAFLGHRVRVNWHAFWAGGHFDGDHLFLRCNP